ncbi:flagellar hook-length control protein FliK [Phycisphaeraceae bacterium D3-23]
MIEAIQALFSHAQTADPAGGLRASAVGEAEPSLGVSFRDELSAQTRKGRENSGETRDRVAGVEKKADDAPRGHDETVVEESRVVEEADGAAQSDDPRELEEQETSEQAAGEVSSEDAAADDAAGLDAGAAQKQGGPAAAAVEASPVAASAAASSQAGGEAAVLAQEVARNVGDGKRVAESAPGAQAGEGKARQQAVKDTSSLPSPAPQASGRADATTQSPIASTAQSTQQQATETADTKPLAVQTVAQASAAQSEQAAAATTAATPTPSATLTAVDSGPALPTPVGATGVAAQRADAAAAREADTSALNSARLTRGLASAVNQRGGAVTLRLTPPDMGTVRIQMQLTGAILSASLHTETASAHQLLTQQLGQLRTSLESQGLTVERLHVQPMQPAQQSGASDQNNEGDQQRQHNEGRSRGRQEGGGNNSRGGAHDNDAQRDGRPDPQTFDDHLTQSPADAAA